MRETRSSVMAPIGTQKSADRRIGGSSDGLCDGAVVSAAAPAYAHSIASGRLVSHEVTTRIADGMACRTPNNAALEIIRRGVARVVLVTDDEVEAAMRAIYDDTHNVAEGAGASGLAALLQERDRTRGKKVGFILTGANVDAALFSRVLTADAAGK